MFIYNPSICSNTPLPGGSVGGGGVVDSEMGGVQVGVGGVFRWRKCSGGGGFLSWGCSGEGSKGANVRGMKGSKGANVRGENLTEPLCNLSLGLEMD